MRKTILLAAVFGLLGGACHGPILDAVPPTQADITRIQNDTTLTNQQKRAALQNLGLTPVAINTVLSSIRTANQFGGDLRTAYDKVTGSHFDQLTPDEVQIYVDEAGTLDPAHAVTLTDVQAQAIVTFFQDNHIATKDELSQFLGDPVKAASIPTAIPDNVLNNFFVVFEPALLIPFLP